MKIIYNLALLLLFQFFSSCDRALKLPHSSAVKDSVQVQKSDKAGVANIVFKSTDNGQTWQNISEGLPEPVTDKYGVSRNAFFADDNGLYITAGNWIYHSKSNSTAPFWTKEIFPDE